jgi:hypothetical protein
MISRPAVAEVVKQLNQQQDTDSVLNPDRLTGSSSRTESSESSSDLELADVISPLLADGAATAAGISGGCHQPLPSPRLDEEEDDSAARREVVQPAGEVINASSTAVMKAGGEGRSTDTVPPPLAAAVLNPCQRLIDELRRKRGLNVTLQGEVWHLGLSAGGNHGTSRGLPLPVPM